MDRQMEPPRSHCYHPHPQVDPAQSVAASLSEGLFNSLLLLMLFFLFTYRVDLGT